MTRGGVAALSVLALLAAALLGMFVFGTASWNQLTMQVFSWQQELNRALTRGLRDIREHGMWAAAGLIWLSFGYGVLHAAGPGHGKAVISAYVLADGRRLRQGLALAWWASALQGLVAIALVTAVVLVLGLAARQMQATTLLLERIGYGLIIAIGAVMVAGALRRVLAGPAHRHQHGCNAHDHSHEHERSGIRQGLVVASVGVRPCSGALLVLTFAKAAGVFAAGILATIAMSIGTALTVSVLALLAFFFRRFAMSLVGSEGGWFTVLESGLAGLAGAALVLVGAVLLTASYTTPLPPFRI